MRYYDAYGAMYNHNSNGMSSGVSLVKKLSTENKELYGSVKPTEISKIIQEKEKIDIKPSMIQLLDDIKTLGDFKANINLHSEIQTVIKIKVVSAENIQ